MGDSSTRVIRTTREALPRLPFSELKETVLGADYSLNIVFVSASRSRSLNRRYRQKDKATNLLAFPLGPREGELLVCLSQIKKEIPIFKRPLLNLLSFLLIHGLFHLKGYLHGSRMERNEKRVRARFKI